MGSPYTRAATENWGMQISFAYIRMLTSSALLESETIVPGTRDDWDILTPIPTLSLKVRSIDAEAQG